MHLGQLRHASEGGSEVLSFNCKVAATLGHVVRARNALNRRWQMVNESALRNGVFRSLPVRIDDGYCHSSFLIAQRAWRRYGSDGGAVIKRYAGRRALAEPNSCPAQKIRSGDDDRRTAIGRPSRAIKSRDRGRWIAPLRA